MWKCYYNKNILSKNNNNGNPIIPNLNSLKTNPRIAYSINSYKIIPLSICRIDCISFGMLGKFTPNPNIRLHKHPTSIIVRIRSINNNINYIVGTDNAYSYGHSMHNDHRQIWHQNRMFDWSCVYNSRKLGPYIFDGW